MSVLSQDDHKSLYPRRGRGAVALSVAAGRPGIRGTPAACRRMGRGSCLRRKFGVSRRGEEGFSGRAAGGEGWRGTVV
ncbi:hypothetical protein E2C01_077000 [Portunus trituberculatus]|uniref:Uncharacterized protein n=1 Tax=Portunus trituberculatus TaxID=210409 RepID=A0A5B7IA94_PORTR|nr:hypothetical protein [Portunus trituberculatus]